MIPTRWGRDGILRTKGVDFRASYESRPKYATIKHVVLKLYGKAFPCPH
jgi:hypothetical protein